MENTCTGDKTLAHWLKTIFINRYTFPQIRNTPTKLQNTCTTWITYRTVNTWRVPLGLAVIMSRTLKVTGNHVMYDRGKWFLRVIMSSSLLCLACRQWSSKNTTFFLFSSMYNKTIIKFSFCDIQNNQGLRKGYQPQPSASVDNWISQRPHAIIVYKECSYMATLKCFSWAFTRSRLNLSKSRKTNNEETSHQGIGFKWSQMRTSMCCVKTTLWNKQVTKKFLFRQPSRLKIR